MTGGGGPSNGPGPWYALVGATGRSPEPYGWGRPSRLSTMIRLGRWPARPSVTKTRPLRPNARPYGRPVTWATQSGRAPRRSNAVISVSPSWAFGYARRYPVPSGPSCAYESPTFDALLATRGPFATVPSGVTVTTPIELTRSCVIR